MYGGVIVFKSNILGLQVTVDLKPGVYLMGNDSAIGKSRLGSLLEKGFLNGLNTYYYNYSDYVKGLRIKDALAKKSYDVVLLDRVDLYIQEYDIISEVMPYAESTVFLVDLKNIISDVRGVKYCTVIMKEREIKVV